MLPLILASSSVSRKALLNRLQIPYQSISPDIDETPLPQESPADLVSRLAKQKAQAVINKYPKALIIGSDTTVMLGQQSLGKPSNIDEATAQLTQISGKTVVCYTGLALLNSQSSHLQAGVETYEVTFRPLSSQTIKRYIKRDQPLHCAGSIKAESLGIALFSHTAGRDFSTLIGLPLMLLIDMLLNEGIEVI